jgi:hypothetical protein
MSPVRSSSDIQCAMVACTRPSCRPAEYTPALCTKHYIALIKELAKPVYARKKKS